MKNKRQERLSKLADLESVIKNIMPGEDKPNELKPATAPQKLPTDFNPSTAVSYNTRSEETFKTHEADIKKILGTAADWKSPEFAQAVYDWQKSNGLTGKWVDGKFGPLTMSTMTKLNPELKEKYTADAVAPWLPDGKVKLRLTGYWPFTARPDERKMEGGIFDRKMPKGYADKPESPQYQAHVLHTAEQHLADPIKHPFVSLSGDDAIWPYGQELLIPWTNGQTLRGRVVDTGSHFRGAGKVYRSPGYEPIDVCVDSAQTKVPQHVVAQIVGGQPKQTMPPAVAHKISQRIKLAKRKARMLILYDDE